MSCSVRCLNFLKRITKSFTGLGYRINHFSARCLQAHAERLSRCDEHRAERKDFFSDAMDSRSCLTTLLHFNDSPNVEFSFDVAILTKNRNGDYMRLIHNKNAFCVGYDQYTWNEVPKSHDVKEKADAIKAEGLWQEARDRYVELKSMYLSRQDNTHPSFIVYVEAVNEIYYKYFR